MHSQPYLYRVRVVITVISDQQSHGKGIPSRSQAMITKPSQQILEYRKAYE